MNTGISHITYDIPKIYLNIEDFSKERQINAEKLKKGLGIHKMAFLDQHEDTATLAANALLKLFRQNNIDPKSINRIYLGTESALDSSKPTSTYAVEMVENFLGDRVFKHTDVTDMTFACIGAVDVLQNALDYVKSNPNDKAVVIASDFAKYDLNSPGEYTQGAGAVAMLVESNPKLMSFDSTFGVGYKSEHDFFKPRRHHPINQNSQHLTTDQILQVYREEPVFDGQFSNQCYQDRICEAYFHFKNLKNIQSKLHEAWSGLIFHLPYAFHGKRIFSEIFRLEKDNVASEDVTSNLYDFNELKTVSKTEEYQNLVSEKIRNAQRASSHIGNMYSASIFMSLISELWYKQSRLMSGDKLGFIAYGSGSKAKVFEGQLVKGFSKQLAHLNLDEVLKNRTPISFKTYEDLHRKMRTQSVVRPQNEFFLDKINTETDGLVGQRYYKYAK
ncbi:hydroxymethylglutaryl-CoA synthase family protein [Mesohalobacter halotolerans]|uniref:Hydroxymethylglutaryl-CoA synthase family protein n=1 Tax=Mesohalobacter halotolerans TaxID=1883405 RepID=A0A4U5TVY8_9FLAO|nr:hydroxymethylglutaryl-CoA synthase [Mesohalobacter halotolerans]TKS57398.1 hydroxymethylglutaryl-CoA synthase family protein [Mesohalobacter halotolerans]